MSVRITSSDLKALRESLTDDELEDLAAVLVAMRRHVESTVGKNSDLVTPAFNRVFTRRLQIFHALNDPDECLNKRSFEFCFKEAMEADGAHQVDLTENPTFPGADAVVDSRVPFSLKTESERRMGEGKIKISKLMESIWTKGLQTPEQFLGVLHHILRHLGGYERILTLRAFGRLSSGAITYELWEIPHALLMCTATARVEDFSPITKAGSTTLAVRYQGVTAFEVVFDGSDQKITIRNLRTRFCVRHGQWRVVNA